MDWRVQMPGVRNKDREILHNAMPYHELSAAYTEFPSGMRSEDAIVVIASADTWDVVGGVGKAVVTGAGERRPRLFG